MRNYFVDMSFNSIHAHPEPSYPVLKVYASPQHFFPFVLQPLDDALCSFLIRKHFTPKDRNLVLELRYAKKTVAFRTSPRCNGLQWYNGFLGFNGIAVVLDPCSFGFGRK